MGIRELLRLEEPADSREGRLTMLALIMMLYLIASFISIAIHEVLGHGLFTVLLGGDFFAVYLAPGSGFASLWFPETMSYVQRALVYLAGMLMQMVFGAAVLFLILPRVRNFIAGLFTLLFSVCLLVHPALYLVMGYYYQNGDTRYAVALLGVSPDAFLVAGTVLAGTAVLLISAAALRFMGQFMEMADEKSRTMYLILFWLPSLLISGILAFALSLTLPRNEMAYPFVNSALLMMFIGFALLLVPSFSEPEKVRDFGIPMRTVFAVAVCFALLMAGWAGVFGLSREEPGGVMLHAPPVETEQYYSDYTIGNAEFTVYLNGTVRADIILRNAMDNPSPLDREIYETFNTRPDWERYVERSRNMLITMLDLPRGMGENLTFSYGYGTVRAKGVEDELGRRSTAYFCLDDIGTRQFYVSPGEQTYQPGMGILISDLTLRFTDPWYAQEGYLDEVRVTWETGLEEVEILAWNEFNTSISWNRGSISDNTVGWKNLNHEGSPSEYMITFKYI